MKWFFVFLSIAAISIACGVIFTTSQIKNSDSLAQQIKAIKNTHVSSRNKVILIGELIKKYNPTNAISTMQVKPNNIKGELE